MRRGNSSELEQLLSRGSIRLAIGLAPVTDAANFDGAIAGLAEDEPSVADTKAVPWRIEAFQLLHVAGVGCQESR